MSSNDSDDDQDKQQMEKEWTKTYVVVGNIARMNGRP